MHKDITALPEKYILGVKINTGFDMASTIKYIDDVLQKESSSHQICTTNPEMIVDCQSDASFKEVINNSSLSVPDGTGILMASCYKDLISKYDSKHGTFSYYLYCFLQGVFLGLRFPVKRDLLRQRVTGVALTYKLCELAANKGYSVYLLGGWPRDWLGRNKKGNHNLAAEAASKLRKMYPSINIIGASSSFSSKEVDDMSSLAEIHKCMSEKSIERLDILLVAYNYNSQEKWISRNISKVPTRISVGVGGTFDYINGNKGYSPAILRNIGLEWVFKLITQPWRWRRVSKAFPIFPLKVFLDAISH